MNKKIAIILSIILLIIVAGFLYIKFNFLKTKDFKPDASKEKSSIDLRPSIISKLQQLVKDGSNGLYKLSIEKINPDVFASKLDVLNASINIDTAAMLRLDSLKLLPDDIFTLHFDSLHIDGLEFEDLLNKNSIDITAIKLSLPVIHVYHKLREYNQGERERNDTLSLYHRIKGQLNKISIGNISIDNGTFIDYDVARGRKIANLNNIAVRINDVMIDSSTQFDTDRFMFAKHSIIDAKNYVLPTPDSLYYFKTGAISILAEQHKLVLQNVELVPRYNRKQFESKLQYRDEMYHIVFPRVTLNDVDWWALMNREKLIAERADVEGGLFSIFLDRSLPKNPGIEIDNFPQQHLMRIPLPVSIINLNLKDVNVSYEEFNPDSKKGATAYFDKINARVNYASNISADIKKHPVAIFSGSAKFMHKIPMSARFTFDLLKYKTGEFTADVHMDTLDNDVINPIAEPLALFSIKSGKMQQGTAHIKGNNFNSSCKIAIAYSDLHVKPLKKADESGQLKKKHLTGLFANVFLIKNENKGKGNELRQPEFSIVRDHHRNFVNMVWLTILTGILKTIGVPVKFVIR